MKCLPKDDSSPGQHIKTAGEPPREAIIWVNACGIAGWNPLLLWASAAFALRAKWRGSVPASLKPDIIRQKFQAEFTSTLLPRSPEACSGIRTYIHSQANRN